jgi:hypothetical protein
MRYIFESLPIILAILAIFSAFNCLIKTSDKNIKIAMYMMIFSSVTLIIAQSSWSMSVFIMGSTVGTDIANYIWTIFNVSTMVTFAYIVYILSEY